jgi:hypothetical protein
LGIEGREALFGAGVVLDRTHGFGHAAFRRADEFV